MRSLISIDYGTWKSGLAYSVEGFAFAYRTVPTRELLSTLEKLIPEKKAEAIIMGMPYNIDGSMSVHARRVEKFAKKLETALSIPVILNDERLTTSEAIMGFDEMGVEGDIDAEAARLILLGYIESLKK